ncbi:MAG: AAA family ATPase [Candidatus Krumholzibacteria bacterium]|nr:AAA family ATPase [Candidatus Krumholzibacteria bacterium]
MLTQLRIRNLAIVDDITLVFAPGLNVLTGATGAGKSLIVGAVNWLLGEKAELEDIRRGEEMADVEATFAADAAHAAALTVRRVVRRSGRGRCFIDGRPVTARELRETCARLVAPHGQNEQSRLRDPTSHAAFLDAFAHSAPLLARYHEALAAYRCAHGALSVFTAQLAAAREKRELLEHRLGEVERARLQRGEREEIERKMRVMAHAERIAEALAFACEALYDADDSAAALAARVRRRLETIAEVDERLAGFASQVEAARLTLDECAAGLRAYLVSVEYDPAELRRLEDRLALVLGLEKRYGMSADVIVDEALRWREALDGIALSDERRSELESACEAAAAGLARAAHALGETRRRAGVDLDARMSAELEALEMRGARFRTLIERVEDPASDVRVDGHAVAVLEDGADVVRFRVRSNPGELEGGVERIASTGEASRIALALKRLTGEGAQGTTLVFDEIDAGVGADLGAVIGEKLLDLSARYQVVCITHMPQIAARGRLHLVVSKRGRAGRVAVEVTAVAGEARRREIARMLGGEEGSAHRAALADELLRGTPTAAKRTRMRP